MVTKEKPEGKETPPSLLLLNDKLNSLRNSSDICIFYSLTIDFANLILFWLQPYRVGDFCLKRWKIWSCPMERTFPGVFIALFSVFHFLRQNTTKFTPTGVLDLHTNFIAKGIVYIGVDGNGITVREWWPIFCTGIRPLSLYSIPITGSNHCPPQCFSREENACASRGIELSGSNDRVETNLEVECIVCEGEKPHWRTKTFSAPAMFLPFCTAVCSGNEAVQRLSWLSKTTHSERKKQIPVRSTRLFSLCPSGWNTEVAGDWKTRKQCITHSVLDKLNCTSL